MLHSGEDLAESVDLLLYFPSCTVRRQKVFETFCEFAKEVQRRGGQDHNFVSHYRFNLGSGVFPLA